jgi:hypothetical protein
MPESIEHALLRQYPIGSDQILNQRRVGLLRRHPGSWTQE